MCLIFSVFLTVFCGRTFELLFQRVQTIIRAEWKYTKTDGSYDMVETTTPTQSVDGQTQFGNTRYLDPSDCIFVFKNTLSDYEEPPSDEEVSTTFICRDRFDSARRFNKTILYGEVVSVAETDIYIFRILSEYRNRILCLKSNNIFVKGKLRFVFFKLRHCGE